MVQASKTENDSALSDKERMLRLGVLGEGAAVCKIGVIKSRDPLSEASVALTNQHTALWAVHSIVLYHMAYCRTVTPTLICI
jgi:hypothetical protein